MIIWKDTTKYKTTEERIPRVWETKVGGIRVMVRRYTGKGDTWFATIKEFGIDRMTTVTDEADYAKSRSLVFLQAAVETQIAKLTATLEEIIIN